MALVIDSHHHFWKYGREEYSWIGEGQGVLRRDFMPADLKKEIDAARVDGVVSVQARQSLEETRWLLELAGKNDFIRGVVGWAPLISPQVEKDLEEFTGQKKLKGIRHVLQDEKDDRYAVREDFVRGIGALKKFKLVYDILIYEKQLPAAIELVDKFPNQIFVLDHAAKPKIREKIISPWRERMPTGLTSRAGSPSSTRHTSTGSSASSISWSRIHRTCVTATNRRWRATYGTNPTWRSSADLTACVSSPACSMPLSTRSSPVAGS
jgi:predicted TIM-barrel fold metal-dependent hydrolase